MESGDTASASGQSADTFASHFQKSSAGQGNEQPTVPQKAASALALLKGKKEGKESRPTAKSNKETKQNDDATAAAAPIQQLMDVRSWLLSSWQNGQASTETTKTEPDANTGTSRPATGGAADALKNVLQSGAPGEAHALQKAEIAFSVTIPPTDSSRTSATQASAEAKPMPATPKGSDLASSVKAAPAPANILSKTNAGTDAVGAAGKTAPPAVSKPSAKENGKHSSDKGHSNTAEKDEPLAGASASKFKEERESQAGAIHSGASAAVHAADSSAAAPSDATNTPQGVTAAYSGGKTESVPTTSQTAVTTDDLKPTTIAKPQSIDLKVGTQDGEQVDVRVSQRAGDVQVTVRTADGQLAQSLRHHLPELSDRLAQNGIQGDFWQPSAAQSSSSHSDGDTQEFSDRNDAQSQGQQGQGQNRSNPEGEDKRQSAWLNEMDNVETRN